MRAFHSNMASLMVSKLARAHHTFEIRHFEHAQAKRRPKSWSTKAWFLACRHNPLRDMFLKPSYSVESIHRFKGRHK